MVYESDWEEECCIFWLVDVLCRSGWCLLVFGFCVWSCFLRVVVWCCGLGVEWVFWVGGVWRIDWWGFCLVNVRNGSVSCVCWVCYCVLWVILCWWFWIEFWCWFDWRYFCICYCWGRSCGCFWYSWYVCWCCVIFVVCWLLLWFWVFCSECFWFICGRDCLWRVDGDSCFWWEFWVDLVVEWCCYWVYLDECWWWLWW